MTAAIREDPLASVLRSYGYGPPLRVEGRTSVADLFPRSKRSGIYVLECGNGEQYAGKSVDVTRRYVQHLKTHHDVVWLWFKVVDEDEHLAFEEELIHSLQRSGLPIRNIVHASDVAGETDLDLVMTPESQEQFEASASHNDASGTRTNDLNLRRKIDARLDRLLKREGADEVVALLQRYIPLCIPAFIRTELAFWSLSIPPRPPYVYLRVNVGWQEVLTALVEEDGSIWLSFHVARSPLGIFERKGPTPATRELKALGASLIRHNYAPGGPDQVKACVALEDAPRLLAFEPFARAARLLNLRLMRKSYCPSSKWHCFALADRILETR